MGTSYQNTYSTVNNKSELDAYSAAYRVPVVTIGDRIKTQLVEAGLSQAELARRVGISQPAIHGLIKGDARSSKHLHRIARELGTTPAYLAGETDDSSVDAVLAPSAESMADQLDVVMVPHLDLALSMGGGDINDGVTVIEHVPIPREWLRGKTRGRLDQVRVVSPSGDSMKPTIGETDVLLVDEAQRTVVEQDVIWAFAYGDLGMVKRLRRQPDGRLLIQSDNHTIKDFSVSEEEINMIGRVIAVMRWTT